MIYVLLANRIKLVVITTTKKLTLVRISCSIPIVAVRETFFKPKRNVRKHAKRLGLLSYPKLKEHFETFFGMVYTCEIAINGQNHNMFVL